MRPLTITLMALLYVGCNKNCETIEKIEGGQIDATCQEAKTMSAPGCLKEKILWAAFTKGDSVLFYIMRDEGKPWQCLRSAGTDAAPDAVAEKCEGKFETLIKAVESSTMSKSEDGRHCITKFSVPRLQFQW